MSLLSRGADRDVHTHTLPTPPNMAVPARDRHGVRIPGARDQLAYIVDAVASCGDCGALFVTRPLRRDAHGRRSTQWVPLRWWHRNAHRLMRETELRAEPDRRPRDDEDGRPGVAAAVAFVAGLAAVVVTVVVLVLAGVR